MDILFFFTERTSFIRMFYEKTGSAFNDVISAIESGQPPYDDAPPYDESDEPPFMREWALANDGVDVVGLTCVSMLSASLQAYLHEWEREMGVKWEPNERNRLWKKKGLSGYVGELEQLLKLTQGQCPADLEVLEQATLARNAAQHPERITDLLPQHRRSDLAKYPRPFFMSSAESLYLEGDLAEVPFLVPRVRVSREKLHHAIAEADKLARWLG